MEYSERLRVPLRWWVQATMFVASVWLAFIVALPAVVAWAATGVMALMVVALFLGYGSAQVRVDGETFRAGRAEIALRHLSAPVALDAVTTRLTTGRDADARAYLLIRPYLKRSVRVAVDDPADPAPYWLVSSRRPEALTAALRSALDRHPG